MSNTEGTGDALDATAQVNEDPESEYTKLQREIDLAVLADNVDRAERKLERAKREVEAATDALKAAKAELAAAEKE